MRDVLRHPAVEALIARSNTLGSDPTTTNYGGGNTSAKAVVADPASGDDVEVLLVKGSGGDLGTLTPEGLSVLIVERLRGLAQRDEPEDELHELLPFCAYGPGGAPPSIDTSMHGLVEVPHVDHLHPDAVIAIAAARDGEELTKRIYGDEVAWVPWIRPGFDLGRLLAHLQREQPELRGVVLGGHGLTAWGDDVRGVRGDVAGADRPRRAVHRDPRRPRAARAACARASGRCRSRSGWSAPRCSRR